MEFHAFGSILFHWKFPDFPPPSKGGKSVFKCAFLKSSHLFPPPNNWCSNALYLNAFFLQMYGVTRFCILEKLNPLGRRELEPYISLQTRQETDLVILPTTTCIIVHFPLYCNCNIHISMPCTIVILPMILDIRSAGYIWIDFQFLIQETKLIFSYKYLSFSLEDLIYAPLVK